MTILLLLVPISVLLLGAAVAAFAWAVRSGQFDDLDTPAVAMLADASPLAAEPLRRTAQASGERGPHRLRSSVGWVLTRRTSHHTECRAAASTRTEAVDGGSRPTLLDEGHAD